MYMSALPPNPGPPGQAAPAPAPPGANVPGMWSDVVAAWDGKPNSNIYVFGGMFQACCAPDFAHSTPGAMAYIQPPQLLSAIGYILPAAINNPGSPMEAASTAAQNATVLTVLSPGAGGHIWLTLVPPTFIPQNDTGSDWGGDFLNLVALVVVGFIAWEIAAPYMAAASPTGTTVAPNLSGAVVVNADGSITTVAADGTTTTVGVDGTTSVASASGSPISTTMANGDIMTFNPDGTVNLPPDLTASTDPNVLFPQTEVVPPEPVLATPPIDAIPSLPAADAAALAASQVPTAAALAASQVPTAAGLPNLNVPPGAGALASALTGKPGAGNTGVNQGANVLAPSATLSPWSFILLGAIAVIAIGLKS